MDILKYGFNIDPVEQERKELEAKKRIQRLKKHKPKIALRFIYVNTPTLDTIFEESEV
jgi:hypothetical protein